MKTYEQVYREGMKALCKSARATSKWQTASLDKLIRRVLNDR